MGLIDDQCPTLSYLKRWLVDKKLHLICWWSTLSERHSFTTGVTMASSGLVEKAKDVSFEATSFVVQSVLKERDKVFSRPGDAVRKKDGLVEEVVRSAASGFGVISEALHHRKEEKANQLRQNDGIKGPQPSDVPPQSRPDGVTSCLGVGDQEFTTPKARSKPPKDSKHSARLAAAFISRRACPDGETVANDKTVPLPVVLAQRRPEKRTRGFMRAYAPVLAEVGVDQGTFLDFIDGFNKALEPNPWINALNLAGFAGSAMPEPASMLFGFTVEYATGAALEGRSRYSSNTFLDRVNAQYFRPRGLVCLVVTWQPGIGDSRLAVNFERGAPATRSETGLSERRANVITQKSSARTCWQDMKEQMGERMKMTNGNLDWPEPAPLVFPANGDETEGGSGIGAKKKKDALDRMEAWMEDISDKRAQAKWVDENGDNPSAGLTPKHEFRSRYADPKHPAASGDMVALVTGGHWMYTDTKNAKEGAGESKPETDTRVGKSEGGNHEKKSDAANMRASLYVALSYCWGKSDHLLTNKKNLQDMKIGVHVVEFPQTIRDAVEATRRLNLRYFWVDTICISQDSARDWEVESAKMASVYHNAYLTVAAGTSACASEGFLDQQHLAAAQRTQFKMKWRTDRGKTSILAWICQTERDCECHAFEEITRDGPKAMMSPALMTSHLAAFEQWQAVVSGFSTRKLSYELNKLPALSGLASLVQEKTGSSYIAGLWRDNFVRDLNWYSLARTLDKLEDAKC
ncbi:heterokaryon incompatibility protein-domain-containing protein [Colletotrichum navitas]|uniref:Heterokaryon incompatibility protein-domain-containing protein n=1 Tax=Colletotrichum navitas TaxID=681940 RepID=A0AAD8UZ38_9PEZI|nr:heterokaryon incompatibility protein-domain-containing protein [Colletotrichum navitas]KAK1572699.1 heterokaryon incompatibility protein-domain-containing protein [Colletotrichum navitas]